MNGDGDEQIKKVKFWSFPNKDLKNGKSVRKMVKKREVVPVLNLLSDNSG